MFRRRRLQFSIRTLLIVTAVIAGLLAVLAPRFRQQVVLGRIHQLNGSATTKPACPTWVRQLLGRRFLVVITEVSLYKTQATDNDLSLFESTRDLDLTTLTLDRTKITDAGLVHLKNLRNLEALYLADTQITDAGLAHLTGLENLEELDLSGTQATDAGLKHLCHLPRLKWLFLPDKQVTEAGKQELLRSLPQLRFFEGNRRYRPLYIHIQMPIPNSR